MGKCSGNLRRAGDVARIAPVEAWSRIFQMEAAMSLLALLSLAVTVLLYGALPARGQELPEGKGKEIVAASCNSCHPFQARLGAGYTAEGWRTVMRMMSNHGVVVPAEIGRASCRERV